METSLGFWQQFAVESFGGAVAGLLVGVAGLVGFFAFRNQERIRWQEETEAELAKVRQRALIRCLRAVGGQVGGSLPALVVGAKRPDATARDAAHEAFIKTARAIIRNGFLLPDELANALLNANKSVAESTTVDEMNAALERLADVIDPYLPVIRRVGPRRRRSPASPPSSA